MEIHAHRTAGGRLLAAGFTLPQQLAQPVQQLAQRSAAQALRTAAPLAQPAQQLAQRSAAQALQATAPLAQVVRDVPIALPTAATPEAIADAAWRTAKGAAEQRIRDATGIPLRLPSKLTAQEIGRTIGAMIPTDIAGVVNTALAVGAQAAAQALTGALAGAGIGSVIPGFGTLVGIGVGLAFQAFQRALAAKPSPNLRKCDLSWTQPIPPEDANAFELIAWSSREAVPLSRALADERARRYCGIGKPVAYLAALGTMRSGAIAAAMGSAPRMSFPDVLAALQALSSAPDGRWYYDTRPRSPTERQVVWDRYVDDLPKLIAQLRARQAQLQQLARALVAIPRMSAAQLASLRFVLVQEVTKGAVAYQLAPSAPNAQWLRRLVDALDALQNRTIALRQATAAQLAAARARGAQRLATDPLAAARHSAQIQAFLRSERQV